MKKLYCWEGTIMKRMIGVFLGLSLFVTIASAQIGIFDTHQDVGDPVIPSNAPTFADGKYTMDGVGSTIGRRSF